MKPFIAAFIAILLAIGLLFFNSNKPDNNAVVTGLPWQIDILPEGNTRVFGITLGQTTLGEAIALLGDDLDLAIIAAPHETGALEAYYSRYSAGPITGKLLLILDIAPETLAPLRERAFQDGGMRRYRLHPDDLPVAYQTPVSAINFLPSFNLDEEIAQNRFGVPAEIIQVRAEQKHFLYPEKGLDLILNEDGKEILQYLSPGKFSAYRARLKPLPASSENPEAP
jgi:hypothetical protein